MKELRFALTVLLFYALATGYTASAAACFLRGCRMAHEVEYGAATGHWRATAHGHETLRRAESEDTPCPF